MEQSDSKQHLDSMGAQIAEFSVGFVSVTKHQGVEDADSAGSGTLVAIGPIHGILTTAHVLENLPDEDCITLVSFPRIKDQLQKKTISISANQKLILGSSPFDQSGPDIGFLQWLANDQEMLKLHSVFYNLEKRADRMLSEERYSKPYFDGLIGVLAERTTDAAPLKPQTRLKTFEAMYGTGTVVAERRSNDFDVLDFEVEYNEGHNLPDSFKGTSGGGLWRTFCMKDAEGNLSFLDKGLLGVAYYESEITIDKKKIITCHGPESVYRRLIRAIRDKWPAIA